MELKFIDNPVRLQAFLNEPGNTENIVEPGHTYYIKPDAVYLGIYEGLVLAGVHEVRNFWHSVVECHAVYDPGFRGEYALQGHRLFCKWLLENSPFLNSVAWFLTQRNTDGQLSVCLALPVLVTWPMHISDVVSQSA